MWHGRAALLAAVNLPVDLVAQRLVDRGGPDVVQHLVGALGSQFVQERGLGGGVRDLRRRRLQDVPTHGVFPSIESEAIEIASAPRPEPSAADQEIVRLLRADPNPEEIQVVTSDRGLADQVRSRKATSESAEAFRRQIEAA